MGTQDWTRRRWLSSAGIVAASVAAAAGSHAKDAPQPAIRRRYPATIPVALLLGPNATLIDFAGPWEVLGAASYVCPGFNVYSVAQTRAPILADDARSVMGGGKPPSAPTIVPDYTFDDAPIPRVLIMGAQMGDDPRMFEWIRHVGQRADLVASVCTGAFLLAKSGLLDGKRATTNRNAYDQFAKSFPKVTLVRGVRFVDDGHVATSTGLTAGIDLALHVVKRFYGAKAAERVAAYEEWTTQYVAAGAEPGDEVSASQRVCASAEHEHQTTLGQRVRTGSEPDDEVSATQRVRAGH
jgi:transcriptional regulator GlxA family with amidase domain